MASCIGNHIGGLQYVVLIVQFVKFVCLVTDWDLIAFWIFSRWFRVIRVAFCNVKMKEHTVWPTLAFVAQRRLTISRIWPVKLYHQ